MLHPSYVLLRMRFALYENYSALGRMSRPVRRATVHNSGSGSCERGDSMIRRTKAKTPADSATIRTEYDEQSETDTQSQISEEANNTPQTGQPMRKTRVCVNKDCLVFIK